MEENQFVLECTFVNHNQQQVVGICVFDDCQNKRPSCFQCIKEFHSQHFNDVLHYQQYQSWINDVKEQNAKLKNFFTQYQKMSDLATKTINQMNNLNLQSDIKHFSFEELDNQVKAVKQLYINVENLKPKIDHINQLVHNLLIEYPIRKLIHLDQIYKFSKTKKHESITLLDDKLIESNAPAYCLCEPEIKNNQKIRVEFLIIECNEVHIGICQKSFTAPYKYSKIESNIWIKEQHGFYLIENDGHSYSHHNEKENCKPLSFKFSNNDIIILEIDPNKKLLTWTKKYSNENFTLNYELKNDLYIVVGLESGGKVSIAN